VVVADVTSCWPGAASPLLTRWARLPGSILVAQEAVEAARPSSPGGGGSPRCSSRSARGSPSPGRRGLQDSLRNVVLELGARLDGEAGGPGRSTALEDRPRRYRISLCVSSSVASPRTRAVFSSHGRTRRVSQTGSPIQSPCRFFPVHQGEPSGVFISMSGEQVCTEMGRVDDRRSGRLALDALGHEPPCMSVMATTACRSGRPGPSFEILESRVACVGRAHSWVSPHRTVGRDDSGETGGSASEAGRPSDGCARRPAAERTGRQLRGLRSGRSSAACSNSRSRAVSRTPCPGLGALGSGRGPSRSSRSAGHHGPIMNGKDDFARVREREQIIRTTTQKTATQAIGRDIVPGSRRDA